jgi:methanogenic corrinoid protein MtbC1
VSSADEDFDLRDAAASLGVHYQTAYRWVRTGRLAARLVDGRYVVRAQDVAEVLAARRRPVDRTPPSPRRLERQADAMGEALMAGDERRAASIARQLVAEGTSVSELIQRVLVPPLRAIGEAWRDGRLTIWVEHRASAMVERILGELAPNPRGRRRGTAVVATVEGDRHALPTAMAAVALREANWSVHHLGADLPSEELLRFCAEHDVTLAVLTSTNPDTAETAQRTAEQLRRSGTPTIVGGAGRSLDHLIAEAAAVVAAAETPRRTSSPRATGTSTAAASGAWSEPGGDL